MQSQATKLINMQLLLHVPIMSIIHVRRKVRNLKLKY
jgi:hypothetical protein